MNQCDKLLAWFSAGRTLTVAEALEHLQIYALSQRCGELRRDGVPIVGETVTTAGGAHVKRYRLAIAHG